MIVKGSKRLGGRPSYARILNSEMHIGTIVPGACTVPIGG
jgi:hypothetical protein